MTWEIISAVLLLLGLAPLWVPLALVWGVVNFILALSDSVPGSQHEMIDALVLAGAQGMEAFLSIQQWFWQWVLHTQPWWLFLLIALSYWLLGSRINRRKKRKKLPRGAIYEEKS